METQNAINTTDMTLAILAATNDGDLLAPHDLALTEAAVNGMLSESGLEKFEALHDQVCTARTYDVQKQWLHGFEGVTMDHQGYVYWRGVSIEHYSHADLSKRREATRQLQQACLAMERHGIAITSTRDYLDWFFLMLDPRPLERELIPVETPEQLAAMVSREGWARFGPGKAYALDRAEAASRTLAACSEAMATWPVQLQAKVELYYRPSCHPAVMVSVDAAAIGGRQTGPDALRAALVQRCERRAVCIVTRLVLQQDAQRERLGLLFNASGQDHEELTSVLSALTAAVQNCTG